MEEILDTPVQQNELNYAGFGIRLGAALIDGIILNVAGIVVTYTIDGTYSFLQPTSRIVMAINIIIGILYYCGLESSAKQGTLGKQAVRIKVGNHHGEKISFMNALGRYLSKMVSGLILGIGFLMVIWDDKKQGLHDRMAGTVVFKS